MQRLTKAERRVLDAISAYIQIFNMPPLNTEIGDMLKMTRAGVHFHVRNLEKKKYLKRETGRGWRKIKLIEK